MLDQDKAETESASNQWDLILSRVGSPSVSVGVAAFGRGA
jgi:hypothetical protein